MNAYKDRRATLVVGEVLFALFMVLSVASGILGDDSTLGTLAGVLALITIPLTLIASALSAPSRAIRIGSVLALCMGIAAGLVLALR
jgi:hypothetical protein